MKRWACKIVDLITKVAQQVEMRRIGNRRGERAVQRKDFLAHNHIIPTCSIEQETVLAVVKDYVFLS